MRALDAIKKTPAASALTAALGTLALGATLAGCGAAPVEPDDISAKGAACSPDRLEACEKAIAKAAEGGGAPERLVASYAAARSARDPGDAWAKVWSGLSGTGGGARGRGYAVIVDERPGRGGEAEVGAKGAQKPNRFVAAGPLPSPKAIATEDLLIAMGDAAGAGHIVRIGRERITELFPSDPLGPFMAGIRPVIHAGAAPSAEGIANSIALAASVRKAIEAAADFRYIDAAKEADALDALIKKERAGSPKQEPALRAIYAFQLLAAAGIALEPEGDDAEPPADEPPPPSPTDTPYGDLLRVRTAKDPAAAWTARGPAILPSLPSDRREPFAGLFKKADGCAAAAPPPMEGPRDLVFAAKLATSLARGAPEPAAAGGSAGQAAAKTHSSPSPTGTANTKPSSAPSPPRAPCGPTRPASSTSAARPSA